jgi:hypothetical protein
VIKRLTAIIYHFLLEFTLGLQLLFFYYIESKEPPPILALFGLCFGALILLVLLLEKFAQKGKWLYLIIVLPLLLAAGVIAHFSFYIVLLIGLFIFWRGLSLYSDYTGHSDTLFLLLTFMFGIFAIIYSAMLHYPYQHLIVILLIFQIVLVLSGIFFSKWSAITDGKSRFIVYFLEVIGGAAILGTAITLILKYIQTIFFGIINFIALIFSMLTVPVMNIWILMIRLFGGKERKRELFKRVLPKSDKDFSSVSFTLNFVYLFIIAACIGILIYYIRKKRVNFLLTNDYFSTAEFHNGGQRPERGLFFRNRVKPPEDPIRREIFQLEKYAYKLHLGRLPFETLDEWWRRMGLKNTQAIHQIYDKIRYGMARSSQEEQVQVKEVTLKIKQEIKEIAKSRKQAEK